MFRVFVYSIGNGVFDLSFESVNSTLIDLQKYHGDNHVFWNSNHLIIYSKLHVFCTILTSVCLVFAQLVIWSPGHSDSFRTYVTRLSPLFDNFHPILAETLKKLTLKVESPSKAHIKSFQTSLISSLQKKMLYVYISTGSFFVFFCSCTQWKIYI